MPTISASCEHQLFRNRCAKTTIAAPKQQALRQGPAEPMVRQGELCFDAYDASMPVWR